MQTFIRKHKSTWAELEDLLLRFQKQKKHIRATDIDQLNHLYKTVSTHYAYLQTYHPHDETTTYLNQLTSRAHHVVYEEQNQSRFQLKYFFQHFFIQLIHKRRHFILLAMFLFIVGGISGFISVMNNPLHLYLIVPPEMAEGVDPERLGEGHDQISHVIMSSQIMTNNIQVAIMAFLGGITLGIFTVYILVYNGIIIGALAAVFWQAGQSYPFWAYILPHGVIELAVIFVAGGAGLYMGYRILVPGTYPRKIQFHHATRESLQLLLGTFPLFILAALIEGYITPSSLSLEAKYLVALVTLVLLIGYYYKASFDLRSKYRLTAVKAKSSGATSIT